MGRHFHIHSDDVKKHFGILARFFICLLKACVRDPLGLKIIGSWDLMMSRSPKSSFPGKFLNKIESLRPHS